VPKTNVEQIKGNEGFYSYDTTPSPKLGPRWP